MAEGIIDIKYDARLIKSIVRFMTRFPSEAPIFVADAMNRSATATRTAIVKRITETHIVEPSAVRKTIKVTKANRNNLTARIASTGVVIRLMKFNIAQGITRKSRLKARTLRGGDLESLGRAFIGRMIRWRKKRNKETTEQYMANRTGKLTNKMAVFKREGDARHPIKQLFGPAIPSMLKADEPGQALIEQQAMKVLENRIDRGFTQLMKRMR